MSPKKILITIGVIALISYLILAYNKSKFPFSKRDKSNSESGTHDVERPSEVTVLTDDAIIYSRATVRYDANGSIITDPNKPADKVADIIIRTCQVNAIGANIRNKVIAIIVSIKPFINLGVNVP